MPAPQVIYISYSSVITQHISTILSGSVAENDIIYPFKNPSDVSISYRIDLPFVFSYFGRGLNTIYITSKGAISISPSPFCFLGSNCFKSFTSTLAFLQITSPRGLIAGYYVDLHLGNITVVMNNNQVVVTYTNMTYQDNKQFYTFQIIISPSGQISINYISILNVSGSSITGYNIPLSGIIQGGIGSNARLTTEQIQMSKQYLGLFSTLPSLLPGIFPNIADIQTGTSFHICPVSTMWTLTPSIINSSDVTITNISLISLSHGCYESTIIYLLDSSNPAANYSECVLDDSSTTTNTIVNSTFVAYTCNITNIVSTLTNGLIYIGWRAPSAFNEPQIKALSLSPLTVTVRNTSIVVRTANVTANQCTVVSTLSNVCTHGCYLSPLNITCLSLPCILNNTIPSVQPYFSDYLYKFTNPKCGNTCDVNIFSDNKGICCDISQLDCTGLCYGSSRFAYNLIGNELTCCNQDYHIDCLGYCLGTTLRDACGICNGSDLVGTTCTPNVTIAVNTSSVIIIPTISITSPLLSDKIELLFPLLSSNLSSIISSQTSTLVISNTGDSYIYIQLSITGNLTKAPIISFSQTKFYISPFSSISVDFKTSITYLFVLSTVYFDYKQLLISYTRVNTSDITLYKTFDINIISTNCSYITDRSICMNLPGCIYCLQYPTQRVLLENTPITPRRRLIPDILPFKIVYFDHDYSYGICRDGYDTTDACSSVVDSINLHSSSHSRRFGLGFNVYYFLLGLLLVTIFSIKAAAISL